MSKESKEVITEPGALASCRQVLEKCGQNAGNTGKAGSFAITSKSGFSGQPDGFSLVELLVAVFILTVGLLSGAQLLIMVMELDALARSKTTAMLVAQNELERLADLYRRNPAAKELTIGAHQLEELIEVQNPLTQKVLNRYKITWFVDIIPDPRPEVNIAGRIISVRATPMLAESLQDARPFRNKAITLNTVIVAEQQ